MKYSILVSVVVLGGCATGPWTDFYNDPHPASIPGDIRKLVIDTQSCGHFSGEEPYDAERAAFLKKNIDALCNGIEKRHSKLLTKYARNARNAEASALMAEAWSVFE